jgi:hypothetical protein
MKVAISNLAGLFGSVTAILIVLLAGCTNVLRSDRVTDCVASTRDATVAERGKPVCPQGLEYSLPKAATLLTASRHQVTAPDVATTFANAQAALTQANAAVTKDAAAITAANKTLSDDKAKPAPAATLTSDQNALDAATAAQQSDAAAATEASKAIAAISKLMSDQANATKLRAPLSQDNAAVEASEKKLDQDKQAGLSTGADQTSLTAAQTQLKTDQQAYDAVASVLKADIATAQAAVIQAGAALGKAAADVVASQKKLDDDTAARVADATLTTDKQNLAKATAQQQLSQATLSDSQLVLTAAQAGVTKWMETATLTMLSPVPDPTARYVANVAHNAARDDTQKLSVVNGLLTSSNVTSTDQTPNLIIALADTAITIATMGAGAPVAPSPATPSTAPTSCAYDIARVFDPLSEAERDAVASDLHARRSNITLRVSVGGTPPNTGENPIANAPGLVYRVATPVVVTTGSASDALDDSNPCPLASLPTSQSLVGVVPDSRSQYVISATAGPFTTTNYSYGFANGMLTDYAVTRPSEIAAIANIPVRIAQDIVQIPTSLLQMKLNYDTQATALVNQQTALQQAQLARPTAVVNSQLALVNAQTALKQSQIGAGTAVLNAQTGYVTAQSGLAQAQLGLPAAVVNAQTNLVNAETALQQAKLNQPVAVTNAQSSLIAAETAYQQAQSANAVGTVNSQTALIQAHAALLQAEAALQQAISQQGTTGTPTPQ